MLLSKPEIEKMFHKVAEIWQENKDYKKILFYLSK